METNPIPDEQKQLYRNPTVAANYDKLRFSSFVGRFIGRSETRIVLEFLTRAKDLHTVLDAPCGTARLEKAVVCRNSKMKFVGIDVSVNQIQFGRLKLEDAHLHKQVEFVNCDIEQLPFRDGSFDAAVCMRLTGHLAPDLRVSIIRELARAVRKFVIVEYHDPTSAKGVWRALVALTGWKRFPWFPLDAPHALREMRDAGLHDFAIMRILGRIAESYFVFGRKDESIQEEHIMRVSE